MGIELTQVITCDGCKETIVPTSDYIVVNLRSSISGQTFSGVACQTKCVAPASASVVVPVTQGA